MRAGAVVTPPKVAAESSTRDHEPEVGGGVRALLLAVVVLLIAACSGETADPSPGNLAYLEDRVAVAAGQPQTYGTQLGCAPAGPQPATPLADPAAVDGLRAAAGLEPLADYLAEMAEICSAD
jgi:hypothetical protein